MLTVCPKEEVGGLERSDLTMVTTSRYNHSIRSQVLDVNMTISNRIYHRGESTMKLDIARWNSVSGWREHFLVMALGELCFVYDEVATDVIATFAESGFPAKCPVADGPFAARNVPVQMPPLRHFPALPYGRYRVYIMFNHNKGKRAMRGCLKGVADVTQNLAAKT
ncbi:hypothetical protein ONE63_004844 [Megalurothrips usitatus]|uniref:Uncharacterized protein n=1 Tax=Megalurothrips usitatus TaxID=439358 RepID=A0AAV7X6G3_9NEOP|nr:hypothetical protein ONE63_004844 [Megalurothrips usitatus]